MRKKEAILIETIPTNLGLRPAPPPEPVSEPSLTWWPFLVLGLLITIVFIIRYKSRRVIPSAEKLLEQAVQQAKRSTAELPGRYLALQQQLRSYLGQRVNPRWHAFTSREAENEREQLFSPDDQVHAQYLATAWKTAEYLRFGQGTITESDLDQLIDTAKALLIQFTAKQAPQKTGSSEKPAKKA